MYPHDIIQNWSPGFNIESTPRDFKIENVTRERMKWLRVDTTPRNDLNSGENMANHVNKQDPQKAIRSVLKRSCLCVSSRPWKFHRAIWSEHKHWFWDLRPSIWNLANRKYENRPLFSLPTGRGPEILKNLAGFSPKSRSDLNTVHEQMLTNSVRTARETPNNDLQPYARSSLWKHRSGIDTEIPTVRKLNRSNRSPPCKNKSLARGWAKEREHPSREEWW